MLDKLKELFYSENYDLFWELYKSQSIKNITFDFNKVIKEEMERYSFKTSHIRVEVYWNKIQYNSSVFASKRDPFDKTKHESFEVDVWCGNTAKFLSHVEIKELINTFDEWEEITSFLNKELDGGGHFAYITHHYLSKLIIELFKHEEKYREDL